MPDIPLLTTNAPAVAPSPAQAAVNASAQSRKEPVEVDAPIVQAAKQHVRAVELCRAIQEWLDREAKAKKRAFQESEWLECFGALLDFPDATGLDTPFFFFLENLRFPPFKEVRPGDFKIPAYALKNPLMSALTKTFFSRNEDYYMTFAFDYLLSLINAMSITSRDTYNCARNGAVSRHEAIPSSLLNDDLAVQPVGKAAAAGSPRSAGTKGKNRVADVLDGQAVLSGAARMWLETLDHSVGNALFHDGKVCVLTDFVPVYKRLASTPTGSLETKPVQRSIAAPHPSKPSPLHPDFLALPAAKTGAVAYLHVNCLAVHLASSPIPHHLLTPLHPDSSPPSSPDPLKLTIDSKVLGNTYKATVFSAKTDTGVKLVLKYSQKDELVEEEKALSELDRIEPDLTPKCYGIFGGDGPMKGYRALLLEHGGETVDSFEDLPHEDRQAIYDLLERVHKAGWTQGSFYERNVVRDASGRYRLIDFERAERHEMPDDDESSRLALEYAGRLAGSTKEGIPSANSRKFPTLSLLLNVVRGKIAVREAQQGIGFLADRLQRKMDARRRAEQSKDEEPFRALLDFPGASDFSTPFLLFLRHLHFPSSIPGKDPHSAQLDNLNPLLQDLYSDDGPLRPFHVMHYEQLDKARAEHVFKHLRDQLGPEFGDMPLREFIADSSRRWALKAFVELIASPLYAGLGRLVSAYASNWENEFPNDPYDLPTFPSIPQRLQRVAGPLLPGRDPPAPESENPSAPTLSEDEVDRQTIARAYHRILQPQKDGDESTLTIRPARNVIFHRSSRYLLTECLPLFPVASECQRPVTAAEQAATAPSSLFDPDPSFSNLSFAAEGAVTHLHLLASIGAVTLPEMLWSSLASFVDRPTLQPSVLDKLVELPAFASLSAKLAASGLSLSPVSEQLKPRQRQNDVENQSREFVLSPTECLHPAAIDSEPQDLVLHCRVLGQTYKAVVFAASTPGSSRSDLVLKYCPDRMMSISGEAAVHSEINSIEPEIAPKCHGAYRATDSMEAYQVIVTEYAGEEVSSFDSLTREERLEIWSLVKKLHAAGFEHGSFAARNVDRDNNGRFRLIDFERARRTNCRWELGEAQGALFLSDEEAAAACTAK
ncbi:hypothetical protein JCM11251_006957 [Rhodosporidiobolus azoricus]